MEGLTMLEVAVGQQLQKTGKNKNKTGHEIKVRTNWNPHLPLTASNPDNAGDPQKLIPSAKKLHVAQYSTESEKSYQETRKYSRNKKQENISPSYSGGEKQNSQK